MIHMPDTIEAGPRLEALRRHAEGLLARLIAEREAAEARLAEQRGRDPIRDVTGRSALDNAITRTRRMIEQIDGLEGRGESARAATGDGTKADAACSDRELSYHFAARAPAGRSGAAPRPDQHLTAAGT